MQKIIISFLITIALTFLLGEAIKKKFEEKWFLTISYEHIGRQLDLNYMLLNNKISDRTVENFKYLVANLTSEIISKKTSNACTKVRGLQGNPNILIKFVQLNLEMTMVSSDKVLLEECEKFLDARVKKFNLLNQQIIKTIFKSGTTNPIIFGDIDKVNEALNDLVKQFEKGGLEAFIDNQKDAESKIKYATLMINLINSMDRTNTIENKSFYEIEFVSKSFREIRKKEENKILMYFGLFIIIQSIMLAFFFINKKQLIKIKSKTKDILNF